MTRVPIATPDAPPPAGSYSQAMRAGAMVYIPGQTPRWLDGHRLTGAPFTAFDVEIDAILFDPKV